MPRQLSLGFATHGLTAVELSHHGIEAFVAKMLAVVLTEETDPVQGEITQDVTDFLDRDLGFLATETSCIPEPPGSNSPHQPSRYE